MDNEATNAESYTVVARRYRPKSFSELIGQGHIAQALGRAIESNRVGHAYLFTGARGVGKTSTARIFAKTLNTPSGMSADLVEEISSAVDSGDDMDVIEIDGASNRGIEEIRTLRSNVNVRPSRSPYKIYIIDEVHMLTTQAFNALLKTLEEPPSHVKFIFCTTDPDKIPITVLSRCQRFDFAPVRFEEIQKRLKEISLSEGFEVEDEAIALLARRANGSMRDSQSLLEQVMSFSAGKITVDQVHAMLGTADEGRLLEIVSALRDNSPLSAIQAVEEATRQGSDPGQLAEQLLNYLRDIMTIGIGGGPEMLKLANPIGHSELKGIAESWGLSTILNAIQILDETLVRMRSSVSTSALLEVALVQICQLQHIASIPALLEALSQGTTTTVAARPATVEKKNTNHLANGTAQRPVEPTLAPVRPSRESAEMTSENPQLGAMAASSTIADSKSAGDQSHVNGQSRDKCLESISTTQTKEVANVEVETTMPAMQTKAVDGTKTTAIVKANDKPRNDEPGNKQPATKPAGAASSSDSLSSRLPHGASSESLTLWRKAASNIDGMLADFASMAIAIEPLSSDQWKVYFPQGGSKHCEYCEHAPRKAELQRALQVVAGRSINLQFTFIPGEPTKTSTATAPTSSTARIQKLREVSINPFIKKICETLDGEILRVDAPREAFPTNAHTTSNGAVTSRV